MAIAALGGDAVREESLLQNQATVGGARDLLICLPTRAGDHVRYRRLKRCSQPAGISARLGRLHGSAMTQAVREPAVSPSPPARLKIGAPA